MSISSTWDPRVAFVQAGLASVFLWEFLTSLGFEWSFVTRRRLVTWPMAVYFIGRYVALVTVCLQLYALSAIASGAKVCEYDPHWIGPCSVDNAYEVMGYATHALASMNLAIRAMAAWSHSLKVVIPLGLAVVAQWGLIFWMASLREYLRDSVDFMIFLMLIYTIAFDLATFILTLVKLLYPRTLRSQLVDRILQDGLIYFVLSMAVNLVMVIAHSTGGDTATNAQGTIYDLGIFPAAILSAILSGRLVRRLANLATPTSLSSPGLYLTTEDKLVFQPPKTKNCELEGDDGSESPRV